MNHASTRLALVESLRPWTERCPRDQTWLVGFSGGKDSIALTELLLALGYEKLILIHAHHHLRPTADDDATWVQNYAAERRLTSHVCHLQVTNRADEKKISLELAARELRYAAFAEQARIHQAAGVFLGHQANDQAETVLFRLLRGTGPCGLGGIRADSYHSSGLRLLRPLLPITRSQIDTLFSAEGWPWREDESNHSTAHTRNQLRHQLLPLAEKIMQRDPRPLIGQTAQIIADEDTWLHELVLQWLAEHRVDHLSLPVKKLALAPVALQRRLLHHWLSEQKIPHLSWKHIESVRQLIATPYTIARTNLPGGYRACRRSGRLMVHPPRPPQSSFSEKS